MDLLLLPTLLAWTCGATPGGSQFGMLRKHSLLGGREYGFVLVCFVYMIARQTVKEQVPLVKRRLNLTSRSSSVPLKAILFPDLGFSGATDGLQVSGKKP
jgi:hypothetical protein